MKRTLFLSAILALCLGACEYQECDVQPVPESGESGDYFGERQSCSAVICTANFADISVGVTTASGAPVNLDSFVVTDRRGITVRALGSGAAAYGYPSNGNGRYTVLNDAWVDGHQGLGSYFYAKGYRSGVMVFNETYKISADCCHVSKISGKDRIIVP